MNPLQRVRSLIDFHEQDKEQGVERTYSYYSRTSSHLHTSKQEVDLLESPIWGQMLFLDGVLQSTTKDEVIYHSALVHPLLDTIHKTNVPMRILILGGGEGATAREVLRWSEVEHVTMVDYDDELVDLMKFRGQAWSQGAFNDSRLKLIYDDAWKYMETSPEYDGILIDLTDPDLKKDRWMPLLLSVVKSIKKRQGGFVMNAGLYLPWKTEQLRVLKEMMEELCSANPEFTYHMYTAMVPSFNGEWTFIVVHTTRRHMIEPEHLNILPSWIRRTVRMLDMALLDDVVDTSPVRSSISSFL